jgi:hypothetical protein
MRHLQQFSQMLYLPTSLLFNLLTTAKAIGENDSFLLGCANGWE